MAARGRPPAVPGREGRSDQNPPGPGTWASGREPDPDRRGGDLDGWHTFARAAAERFGAGEFAAVIEVATAGLARHPDCGDLLEPRGVARRGRGKFRAATADPEAAAALVPLGAQGQIALADCYARFGKPDPDRTILVFLAEPGR